MTLFQLKPWQPDTLLRQHQLRLLAVEGEGTLACMYHHIKEDAFQLISQMAEVFMNQQTGVHLGK
jgi:hypothetical protein